MDYKKVLTHLIKAGRDSLHLEKTLCEIGYTDTPYFNLYGEICEAIYHIIGEETECLDDSATYAAIHDIYTPDETCAEYLSLLCKPPLSISENVFRTISETASERGLTNEQMINLILAEWAMKIEFCKAFT